ncbi:hypothetical protein A3F57_01390 [Candidatus Roizmanbacteria bacterium RIFCSPHIGHO2_12_FULL_36_11]|nr:MAG: hypothetical protein A3F57_01390 [Candidatus Roizmanbacteria bacterium RIFCSPHIGHO2_12_FULL_36_11]
MSKYIINFGLICLILAGILLFQRNNPKRIAFYSVPFKTDRSYSSKKNLPTRLVIKDLAIDLPIVPAKVNGQQWETTTQGVSWLTSSPLPGEKGNSIIYGHNWGSLLGKLIRIKPGSLIEIRYSNGSKNTFTVNTIATVSPKEVSVLRQSEDRRITVYTCTGFFDEKRFAVAALLL